MIFFAFVIICYWLVAFSWEIRREKEKLGRRKKK